MGIYNIGGDTVENGYFTALSMFDSIGIIGDSFASGAVYSSGALTDHYNVSWPQVIGRNCGAKIANYTKGGLSAQKWLNDTKYGLTRMAAEKPHGLYIIALGINDAQTLGTEKLGTIADVDSDNTDSFYSYYGRIVRAVRAHAPSAIVLLSTLARWGGTYDQYSTAVETIGAHYSLAVIDLSKSAFFKSAFFAGNQLSNHPTAVNYSAMAKEYANLVEKALEGNAASYSGFIGGQITSWDGPNYFTPEQFGAVGDGVTDDTAAIQAAVNDGGCVLFGAGKTYRTTAVIRLTEGTVLDLNGATINSEHTHLFFNFLNGDSYGGYNGNGNITIKNGTIIGGCISFAHGENIKLLNVSMKNILNDHFMEICACKNYLVQGCSFVGMQNISGAALEYINIDTNCTYSAFPHNKAGQSDPVFYDSSVNENITVKDCYFSLGDGTFAYGFDAVGVHARNVAGTYANGVQIIGNEIVGFAGCGIRVNAMRDSYVAGNYIRATGDGIRIGDVADCVGVVIVDNYVTSANGQKLVRTTGQYTDLTVSGNTTAGMAQDF